MLKGGKGYTIADIEALPEGERAELIDGELFRMDAPVRQHQDILLELAIEIRMYIRRKKGTCKVYVAPFAVRIKKDKRNYVEPDISVVCDKDKLDEKGCQGAREYWIVDPGTETVVVYDFERDASCSAGSVPEPVRYSFSERIKVGIFEELWLNLSKMDFS